MYCAKQQSVFGRLIKMDFQKQRVGALRYWTVWVDEPILSIRSLCVSADKLIARTQF